MIDPANWKKLAAPIPPEQVQWRQDGRPVARDGKYFARFVAYVDAQFVRERLDEVFEGQWNTRLELLPVMVSQVNGDENDEPCAFKCTLTIAGCMREDVGMGRDYKSAASDAFKRAAVRFGVAHELYAFGQNWVHVDADGKFAKPVEDPGEAYVRRINRNGDALRGRASVAGAEHGPASSNGERRPEVREAPPASPANARPEPAAAPSGPLSTDEPSCPKCGGRMWDNRLSKRNPKAPDYKCRSRSCDGVIWPPRRGGQDDLRQVSDDEVAQRLQEEDENGIPF